MKIWDVDVNNTVISKLAESKTNSKDMIGYLDGVIRPLDDEKLLKIYKTISTKIQDFKNIELDAL